MYNTVYDDSQQSLRLVILKRPGETKYEKLSLSQAFQFEIPFLYASCFCSNDVIHLDMDL